MKTRCLVATIAFVAVLSMHPVHGGVKPAAGKGSAVSRAAGLGLKPVSAKKNSLEIAVDPRIELLSIVQYLSDYRESHPGLVTRLNHSYRKDVDAWFCLFDEHPVMDLFSRMARNGFTYDAPPHSVLYLDPDLQLDPAIFRASEMNVSRAGGKKQMQQFARSLRAFAVASGFPEFYRKHAAFYKRIVEETARNVGDEDVIRQLEDYYGEKRGSYTVVISPMLGGGSFGPRIERAGKRHIYCIMGPWDEGGGIPKFGSEKAFHQLQLHEFSHSFVNLLTAKHQSICTKYSHLYEPIADRMRGQAYGNWNTTLNESIIRAVTTRLAYRAGGREVGDRELHDHKGFGFAYTDVLLKKLEEYEQSRDKYPTLDSFYPELVKSLDGFSGSVADLAASDLILNESYSKVKAVVYELPEDDGRDDAIEYVRSIRDKFYGKLEMVDATKLDETALKEQLRDGFVLYTTIGEKSKLLSAATEPLHIKTDGGKLDWNGVNAPVSELRIILVGKNPYSDGICSVYAAGTNQLLVGINSRFHGPRSYHIFQGDKLLKEGFYNAKFAATDP